MYPNPLAEWVLTPVLTSIYELPTISFYRLLYLISYQPLFNHHYLPKGSKFKSILPKSKPDVTSRSIRNARAHTLYSKKYEGGG